MAATSASGRNPFKRCSLCERQWASRREFLDDPAVELVGYQSFIQDEVLGLFLFNHLRCGTTLSVRAAHFEDLHDGPIYALRQRAAATGAEPCLASEAHTACPAACECDYVRNVTRAVKDSQ